MAKRKDNGSKEKSAPVAHGAIDLPAVTVDDYNVELRDKDGFIGDKASKSAFLACLEDGRKQAREGGEDPFGDIATKDLSKKQIDAFLHGENTQAAVLVYDAITAFSTELARILTRFLRQPAWKDTPHIVVGGGFRQSRVGELAIARAMMLLRAQGIAITLTPIRHHPDEAGLIGAAHLVPAWMLKGHEAIIAVDMGGTNVRAGIVKLNMKQNHDLSKAEVWKSDLWRHRDDAPGRQATIKRIADMIETLVAKAEKAGLVPAPVIGIGCPGMIEPDGSISRGGQNLPGGNWESERFNLPEALMEAIPQIDGHPTFIIMHNDAVVQGLSQTPFLQHVKTWAVLTIGTGLGNAHFTNRSIAQDDD